MDLRSGCLFWTNKQGDHPPHAPPLERDLTTQVAILGGGITGAMAAHYLIQAGIETVMVDRRDIARGSTAASTGLLQYELDKPLVELTELVGEHAARRAYQLGKQALDEFQRLTKELRDDCGFARTHSLLLATDSKSAQLLRDEASARTAANLPAHFLTQSDLEHQFNITRPAAILSQDAAQIDPVRFTAALTIRAIERGLQAFAHTQIDRYDSDKTGVSLTTHTGHRLRARHIIFATGYETPEFLKDIAVKLKSTYALATHPIDGLAASAASVPLIWETATPYFYLRTTADNRLIAGGEDDPFSNPATRDASLPAKTNTLLKKLKTLLPNLRDAQLDCAWAGTFAQTPDSLPYIGPHPAFPHGLFALGYGGNGITFGLIAAQLLRDTLLNNPAPDQPIFRFNRPSAAR